MQPSCLPSCGDSSEGSGKPPDSGTDLRVVSAPESRKGRQSLAPLYRGGKGRLCQLMGWSRCVSGRGRGGGQQGGLWLQPGPSWDSRRSGLSSHRTAPNSSVPGPLEEDFRGPGWGCQTASDECFFNPGPADFDDYSYLRQGRNARAWQPVTSGRRPLLACLRCSAPAGAGKGGGRREAGGGKAGRRGGQGRRGRRRGMGGGGHERVGGGRRGRWDGERGGRSGAKREEGGRKG